MKRSGPIKRYTPPRKKRPGTRRGEPTPEEKSSVRHVVYERDGFKCVDCKKPVRWESGYLDSMHLMHIKSRGAGGSWELSNLLTGCPECHMKRHNCGGKPCPSKVKE